ncbi:beta-glucosidase [Nocardioides guangzhouensis]|uniref:Beta-glucosidase n=1 Tax=Nocardioides guangzhouensis TaxID=2497878 RepID=A0A4Q4Z6Z8_9ACTN|nr:GH1 family beta-glucosidase [Nocardioides guangzhouensis]RYP83523.1 beta-glucosidase [Nocardioides guangzhouensis]
MTTAPPVPQTTRHPSPAGFPPDFVWGAATASYQIEGAVSDDGRTPSIWDAYAAEPGRIRNGDTGVVACDHYHRYREDVGLMRDLGLGAYRFSLAWPRILPGGGTRPNPAGLGFYDRLVDRLLEAGITPWATLYHWDLPVEIEQAGGWPDRATADRFAEYAAVAAAALGDRVHHWITLNEPWCSAFLGYGSGIHAPGRADPTDALLASHHLLLGHGRAVEAIRAHAPGSQVGITLNLYPVTPADDAPASAALAHRLDGLHNRWFLDPVFRGDYPVDLLDDLDGLLPGDWCRPGDLAEISTSLDFLGVNYYTRHNVRSSPYPGVNAAEFTHRGLSRAANGWEVDPDGLVEVLTRVSEEYTSLPIYVTENGSAWEDRVAADGSVDDPDRLGYLADHLDACARAREAGADVAGYFAWSLLDNFEWAEGYTMRFGLVHVDYASQVRTVKASGRWYAQFIAAHRDGILAP